MCLHCKQENLSSHFYCQLIEEFGEEACPKDTRVGCLGKMNPQDRLTDPVNMVWFSDVDEASL